MRGCGRIVVVLVLMVVGVVAATQVAHAAKPRGERALVAKLAERFGVNEAQVQQVFDEYYAQTKQEDRAEFESQVDAAVSQGLLSQPLANQLVNKYRELVDYKESLADKTPEERYELMKVKVQEFKTWAKQNDIPRGLWLKAIGRGQLLQNERIYE